MWHTDGTELNACLPIADTAARLGYLNATRGPATIAILTDLML